MGNRQPTQTDEPYTFGLISANENRAIMTNSNIDNDLLDGIQAGTATRKIKLVAERDSCIASLETAIGVLKDLKPAEGANIDRLIEFYEWARAKLEMTNMDNPGDVERIATLGAMLKFHP